MIEIKKEKRNVFNAQKCKQILAKGNEQKIVLLLFFSFTFRNFSHILFYCSLASVIYTNTSTIYKSESQPRIVTFEKKFTKKPLQTTKGFQLVKVLKHMN